jgi:GT2 family glycosyltransferase
VDGDDRLAVRTGEEVGSFDWFSTFEVPPARDGYGVLAFFAAEGACMIRRVAHLQVGGFFEPYFRELGELDLATRLLGAGWDVRYLPTASFNHLRSAEWRMDKREHLRLRVRNNIWYFWRHFPARLAVRRIGAYAAFDFIECAYRGLPGAWVGGVVDAWRQRGLIQGTRQPLGRGALQRIELSRGRAHAALLRHAIASRVSRAG